MRLQIIYKRKKKRQVNDLLTCIYHEKHFGALTKTEIIKLSEINLNKFVGGNLVSDMRL